MRGTYLRLWVVFLLLVSSLFSLYGANTAPTTPTPNNDDVYTLLQQIGVTPFYQNVADFSLPQVGKSSDISLSSYRKQKKWTFLVFWATWCGPCGQELPILEQLQNEFGPSGGLQILSVSVDQGPAQIVERYVAQKGLTFPVFLDAGGQAGSAYNASAIPTLYIISPNWKIVGVVRGALDWGQSGVQELLKKLLVHKEVTSPPSESVAPSVPTVSDLVPPELEILPFATTITPIREMTSFSVDVVVRWKGDAKKYAIKAPKLTLPPEIESLALSSESRELAGAAGVSQLIYSFTLKAKKSGKYLLGPIELAFSPRYGQGEQFARAQAVRVEIGSNGMGKTLLWTILLLLIAVIATFLVIYFKRRKERSNSESENGRENSWEESYHKVLMQKKDLSLNDYSRNLLDFYVSYCSSQKGQFEEDLSKDKRLLENIKYGGQLLSSDDRQFLEKKLEKIFRKPDTV